MPEYTYRFADLLSDSDVAELELQNVRFDRRIIQPGSFTGSISVTNLDIASQVKKIVPAKTLVHIYRDADIWGTYIIWSMRMRSSSRGPVVVEFSGATLESWLHKRIVDVNLSFDEVEQFDIARSLIDNAQIGWNPYPAAANLNIVYRDNVSGVKRTREYRLTDAATVGERLEEIANVDDGFEYIIQTYYDEITESRVREIIFQSTLSTDNNPVVFTYPGSIESYEITYDASEAGTAFWTRGDTIDTDVTDLSEPLMITAPVVSDDWLAAAFPHLDKVIDYSSVTQLGTLQAYARWWADAHGGLWAVPVISINTTDTPTIIPPTALGTEAQFTIIDEMFGITDDAPDFSYQNRIIGIEVSVPERGKTETIRLVIEQTIDPTEMGT